ncbi:hypothetical protein GCM10010331_59780 [Streptomyces xanthochromogenes]|uniref:hypothetical protein n=1 Tax=Streptomyces xanthochromogenes TaxID=67384 RepID=UPI00167213FF|nr:hypothetical protein [Streptomyces xanthochromogenes]GHB63981.1 hypothetical protein GCM10010331_59780 [Streptomyces xanthochromogenes]
MTTDARPPGTPQPPPPAPESEPAQKSASLPRQPAPEDAADRLRSALDLVDPGPVLPNTPIPPRSSPIPPVPSVPRPPEIPPLPVGPPKPLLPPEPLSDEPGPLRPVPVRRPGRVAAAAICVVLGAGLIGGAAAGTWLDGDAEPAVRSNFTAARDLWHSVPVDTLFPPTIRGTGAGPGGADREWTRVGVAPDGDCAGALDPLLLKVLEPVGCARLVRATYTDATASSVITVGLVFTRAEPAAMTDLANRFTTEKLADRSDLMPRAYPVKNTDAAAFGDQQRASWTVRVLTDAPVVVTAVSGFADGRRIDAPQSAEQATADGASGPVAEAGLGHDAKGIADNVERGLRKKAAASPEPAS